MKIAVELPEDIADRLEDKWEDLSEAARNAIAIEGYRSGALSQSQVQRLLGLASRFEVDALLKRAGVYLEYTEEDLDREIESSHKLTDQSNRTLEGNDVSRIATTLRRFVGKIREELEGIRRVEEPAKDVTQNSPCSPRFGSPCARAS